MLVDAGDHFGEAASPCQKMFSSRKKLLKFNLTPFWYSLAELAST
jgi:hypothetical protein